MPIQGKISPPVMMIGNRVARILINGGSAGIFFCRRRGWPTEIFIKPTQLNVLLAVRRRAGELQLWGGIR